MESLYGGKTHRRITVRDIAAAKGVEKWPMLTAYEELTAGIFDSVGIPVLLVGDSAASNFLGYENTIPVTVDELIPLARAVVRGTKRAMVIADLPFGSYEGSAAQALATATRFMKEAGVQGVKLEDGLARAMKVVHARAVSKNHHWIEITIHEGRYHIIRRLIESLGLKVLRLIRLDFGPINLGDMKAGRHRVLNSQELVNLFTLLKLNK